MKKNLVLIAMKISGFCFIILSIVELINYILLIITPLNINNLFFSLIDLLFISSLIPFSRSILWVFILITIIFFLLLGVVLYFFTLKKEISDIVQAKYLLILGMIILLNCFIKLEYIVLLGKTSIMIGNIEYTFQEALYNSFITPYLASLMWYFFYSVICCFFTIGIAFAGCGLTWILQIEKEKQPKSPNQ